MLQNANDDVHIIPLFLDRVLELVSVGSDVLDFIFVVLEGLRTGLIFGQEGHRNEKVKVSYLLHVVASSDVDYDVFCIHELSGNIERIGERD